mmetsp:Transcript_34800/g.29307  ORF Transcript_34800/g.29307 Transcript_34800/m.29307 type:complete len:96 (+) Transcript_34800:303-590(+)
MTREEDTTGERSRHLYECVWTLRVLGLYMRGGRVQKSLGQSCQLAEGSTCSENKWTRVCTERSTCGSMIDATTRQRYTNDMQRHATTRNDMQRRV